MKKITKIKTFLSKQVCDIKLYGIKELLRKFFIFTKVITRTLIDVIAVLPCIIIRLLSPWIIIRIAQSPAMNYGIFAKDLAFFVLYKYFSLFS